MAVTAALSPSSFPQCYDLLFFLFAQDIAHAERAYKGSSRSQCPGLHMAGFAVTLHGRI
jgi:hypothetical protein